MNNEDIPVLKFAGLIKNGLSPAEARQILAHELKGDFNARRVYQRMMRTPKGREALRLLTLEWRTYGVEPPFAEVINVKLLFQDNLTTA